MKYERQAQSFMAVRRILFTETELSAAPVVNNASGVRVDFSFLGTASYVGCQRTTDVIVNIEDY